MEKTLNVLLAALIVSVGFGGAGCSGAVTSYNPTNTSESTNHDNSLDNIVAARSEKSKKTQKQGLQKQCYCLKENEHVLPDVVVNTFLSLIIDENLAHLFRAYYFNSHMLPQDEKKLIGIENAFYQKMSVLGYSQEETLLYFVALTKPTNIIIKESISEENSFPASFWDGTNLNNPNSFKNVLEHERIHYQFEKRTKQERDMLISFHKELMRRNPIWKKYSETIGIIFYANSFEEEEFAPYLIQEYWYLVESVKEEFPQEYNILREIKEAVKAKECDCGSVK